MQFAPVNFPKPEDFIKVKRKKFSDLAVGFVYLVTELRPITTQFGDAFIAQLKDIDGSKCESILPGRVKKEVERRRLAAPFFIHNRGLTPSKRNPNNKYYEFDLLSCRAI